MQRLGHFEVIRELGRGAMGIVYLAFDPQIRRKVAIKVITVGPDQSALQKALLSEARLAGNLAHPNIVTVYQIGEDQQLLYLVMEFVGGGSLDTRLPPDQPAEVEWSLRVLHQAASALDAAHAAKVVHRDVKPSNILITPGDDLVKVADFGLARVFASGNAPSMVAGTPSYMSPEQVEGRALDGRSDQFALAVLAYRMLTGYLPFHGDSMMALAIQIVSAVPRPPHEVNPHLPAAVSAVMAQGLEKQRERRYPSCLALVEALEESLQAQSEPEPQTTSEPEPPIAPPRRRGRKEVPEKWRVPFTIGVISFITLVGLIMIPLFFRLDRFPEQKPPEVSTLPPPKVNPADSSPQRPSISPTPPVMANRKAPKPTTPVIVERPSIAPSVVQQKPDNSEATGALLAAVRDGAPQAQLEALLDRGASPNGNAASNPLFNALESCQEETVATLLNHGADPNAVKLLGSVPLVGALQSQRYGKPCPSRASFVNLLLEKGARPNGVGNSKSPVEEAASLGADGYSFLRLLLDHGASPQGGLAEAAFVAGHRADGDACYNDAVSLLLSKGAKPDANRASYGMIPLLVAAERRCGEIVQMMLAQGAQVDRTDEDGRTALYMVLESGMGGYSGIPAARALLRAGADPNHHVAFRSPSHYDQGATPLLRAVSSDFDLFTLLLENRGDPEQVDATGQTCLHRAVSSSREKVVRALLARGVRVNVRDGSGRTPLGVAHSKMFSERDPIVKMLLAANAVE